MKRRSGVPAEHSMHRKARAAGACMEQGYGLTCEAQIVVVPDLLQSNYTSVAVSLLVHPSWLGGHDLNTDFSFSCAFHKRMNGRTNSVVHFSSLESSVFDLALLHCIKVGVWHPGDEASLYHLCWMTYAHRSQLDSSRCCAWRFCGVAGKYAAIS